MKKLILTISIVFCFATCGFSQNNNIAIGVPTADSSAKLEIASTTQGVLLPRLSTAEVTSIPLPATGLMVFDTTVNKLQVNTGTTLSPVWTTASGIVTDNLGNHTATQMLNMASNDIVNVNNLTATNTAVLTTNTYPTTTGTADQVLKTNGLGALSWTPLPKLGKIVLDITRTASLSIGTAVQSANRDEIINYDTILTGPFLGTWQSANLVRGGGVVLGNLGAELTTIGSGNCYIATEAGYYLVTASLQTSTTSPCVLNIMVCAPNVVNNSFFKFRHFGGFAAQSSFPTTTKTRSTVTSLVKVEAGDAIYICADNSSATTAATVITGDTTRLTIYKVN